ncbi:MAG: hypothetical protein ABIP48_11180, partial [Planctomycetota bacterium]
MRLLGLFSRRAARRAGSLRRNACRPRHRLARLEPLEQRTLLSVGPALNNLNTAPGGTGSLAASAVLEGNQEPGERADDHLLTGGSNVTVQVVDGDL